MSAYLASCYSYLDHNATLVSLQGDQCEEKENSDTSSDKEDLAIDETTEVNEPGRCL